jgi:hypothetical protein
MSNKKRPRINYISQEMIEIREPSFKPYIFIETSDKRPTSISMAAVAANVMKYILLNPGEGFSDVQRLVREEYEKSRGNCILYGTITGFRWVTSPTESIVLDTDGNELRRENGRFWPKSISIGDADRVTLAP